MSIRSGIWWLFWKAVSCRPPYRPPQLIILFQLMCCTHLQCALHYGPQEGWLAQDEKRKECHRMTEDRSTMLDILEEPHMRREGERIRTFHNWPADAPVTSGDLAKAGFFFVGPGDKVQCFCCGGILRCWVHGDSPAVEHKRHFPTCSFILGRAVGNIPVQIGSSDSVDGQLLSQLQRMTMDDQGTAGQAVYPEMEGEESRLTTFHNWPTEASVQPDVLARAGFFYTGAHCLTTKLVKTHLSLSISFL